MDILFIIKRCEDIKEVLFADFQAFEQTISFNSFGFKLSENKDSIFVHSVFPKSLAAKKGMRQNDIVLKVNNHNVVSDSLSELMTLLTSLLPDREKFAITLKRGNNAFEVVFTAEKNE